MFWRPLRRLFVPLLLLLAAVALYHFQARLSATQLQFLDWSPYLALETVLLLSAFFNRSRLFAAAGALMLFYFAIVQELQVSLTDLRALVIYSFASIALPLVIAVLLLVRERGLRSRSGLMLIAAVPVVALIGWVLATYQLGPAVSFVQRWLPLHPYSHLLISLPAFDCVVFALLVGNYRLLELGSEDEAALIAALVFAFITLNFFDLSRISAIMMGAAGVSLALSLVRSSYEMAFLDELTGLRGRRALNDRLKSLGSRYVIAMLDVDHFKSFNDTYGHDVGDDVLKMVASRIGGVGGGGTAYRYGGEEFCVIFPGRDLEHCKPHLEELRKRVERYRLAIRDTEHRKVTKKEAKVRRGRRTTTRRQTVSVTISIGAATRDETHRKPEEVIQAADAALYRAKEGGRNRVEC